LTIPLRQSIARAGKGRAIPFGRGINALLRLKDAIADTGASVTESTGVMRGIAAVLSTVLAAKAGRERISQQCI